MTYNSFLMLVENRIIHLCCPRYCTSVHVLEVVGNNS